MLYRAVHHEYQLHKFAIAWTISRSLSDGDGGHFYNSDYGVRVKGGPDTVVAWQPFHWHGTSLQNYHPETQVVSEFNQAGLSIFTPKRLSNLWNRYNENLISAEELEEEWLWDLMGRKIEFLIIKLKMYLYRLE
jgi:hypothetical protein